MRTAFRFLCLTPRNIQHGRSFRRERNYYWVLADVAGAQLSGTAASNPGLLIDFGEVTGPVTLADAAILENLGTMNSIISVDGFSIAGADAAAFSVGDFSKTLLQGFFDETVAFDVDFLGGSPGDYSAQLIFNTSEGDITFNLAATVAAVPEPTSCLVWALMGLIAIRFARKRH
jgi:hypothetical protein